MVVAAAAGGTGIELLGLEARQHGGVRMAVEFASGFVTREPRWRIAAGICSARGNVVALRVARARAVVDAADDNGAFDVALDEVDQHFLPDARCEVRAPVGAGQALGHAHPGTGGGISRCVGLARVIEPRAAAGAALPMELHLDAVVAIGVHRGAQAHAYADHEGSLHAQGISAAPTVSATVVQLHFAAGRR